MNSLAQTCSARSPGHASGRYFQQITPPFDAALTEAVHTGEIPKSTEHQRACVPPDRHHPRHLGSDPRRRLTRSDQRRRDIRHRLRRGPRKDQSQGPDEPRPRRGRPDIMMGSWRRPDVADHRHASASALGTGPLVYGLEARPSPRIEHLFVSEGGMQPLTLAIGVDGLGSRPRRADQPTDPSARSYAETGPSDWHQACFGNWARSRPYAVAGRFGTTAGNGDGRVESGDRDGVTVLLRGLARPRRGLRRRGRRCLGWRWPRSWCSALRSEDRWRCSPQLRRR